MTVVVLGIDALDPDLVDPASHPNLVLESYSSISTISSHTGEPSTHELWPSIITGLPPEEHGLVLSDGVAWDNSALRIGSQFGSYLLPNSVRSHIGRWLLNNTDEDAFRTPASYYRKNGLTTLFDNRTCRTIGIPNYVTKTEDTDREHELRQRMGDLFERDPEAVGGHATADLGAFYEQCMEMLTTRIAQVRNAVRVGSYELVFGYTSGLDLIGHVTHDNPERQLNAYDSIDEFVGELWNDLEEQDELVVISDHGLQDGVHTDEAMIASTSRDLVASVESVLDVKGAVEAELDRIDHESTDDGGGTELDEGVREHLERLGYMN